MRTTSASKRVYTRKPITVMHVKDINSEDYRRFRELAAQQQPSFILYDETESGRLAVKQDIYSQMDYKSFCEDQERLARRDSYLNAGQILHYKYCK